MRWQLSRSMLTLSQTKIPNQHQYLITIEQRAITTCKSFKEKEGTDSKE
jgi:hypothetical protein